jgi:hypothetical protein
MFSKVGTRKSRSQREINQRKGRKILPKEL